MLDDRGQLVGEGGVVGLARWHGRGHHEAVAVLVLEALTHERGASGSGPEEEAAGPDVGGLPDEIAHPLEPEHRIEDVEGDHRYAAGGVARRRGDEARHGAGLGDAFFQNLPVGRFGVREQEIVVDRLVLLTLRGVDLQLAEQRVHAERTGLVGNDRHDARPDVLVTRQIPQQTGERHGGADGLSAGAGEDLLERRAVRECQRPAGLRDALGDRAAERTAALHHVLVLDGVFRRAEVRRHLGIERLVRDLVLEVETIAQDAQLLVGQLLDLVGGVAALDIAAECPTLDRVAEDRRRLTAAEVLRRGLVGGVELAVVMAAARERAQVVVAEVFDELAQTRVRSEEVLTDVGTGLDRVPLELTVDGGVHLVEQHAVDVAQDQFVPLRPPDGLDHVPAGPAEDGLEFLDDLAVAAYRSVEALQVAVDDEDQIVETLA